MSDLLLLLAIDHEGRMVDTGDAVTDREDGRSGVFQSILTNGMVTVSMGPGRVAVAHPDRYGLTVSGIAECGCSVTHGDRCSIIPALTCGDAWHRSQSTMEPTVPQLDDLL
jgi:hypothetical protein